MTIDEAANLSGIPLEEALLYVDKRLAKGEATSYQLRVVGQNALRTAIEQLTAITKSDPRRGQHLHSTDLDAAKALAKLALDAIKLSGTAKAADNAPGGGKRDLWDAPGSWDLRKPG